MHKYRTVYHTYIHTHMNVYLGMHAHTSVCMCYVCQWYVFAYVW